MITDGTVLKTLMAVCALNQFLQMIPAGKSLGGRGMHLLSLMTRDTVHICLGGMNITLASGSVILKPYPAAVTRRTLVDRIGIFLEHMAIDKTLLGKFWSADMTTAATCMAAGAMVFPRLVNLVPLGHVRTAFQNGRECGKRRMQRILAGRDNILMAFATGFFNVVN